ncbi:MAG: SIS domain-containing protein [Lachnospiraceae bacterium]|nr:SIS domain-containing protein [Lachnospiraceae bacterium]
MLKNEYVKELISLLERTEIWINHNQEDIGYDKGIEYLFEKFSYHKKQNSQVFFIGNGGSSAIASHMTADFMKNGGMKTYSLYDNAVTTCMGNDYGYEYVFSKPLEFLGNENDLLVAISSSGNSLNICNAIEVAKNKKMGVITLTGFRSDNKVKQLGNVNIYIPSEKYGYVESIHNLMLQQIVDMILERDGARI